VHISNVYYLAFIYQTKIMSSFLLPESAFLIRTEIVRSAGSFIAAASNGTVLPPESTFFFIFNNSCPHSPCPGYGNPCWNRPRTYLCRCLPPTPFTIHDALCELRPCLAEPRSHKSLSRRIVLGVMWAGVCTVQ
jgi:hypothetical protein